jgi:hypothetical protein
MKKEKSWSRILKVQCVKCSDRVCYYQKDKPGTLERMFIEHMLDRRQFDQMLTCEKCGYVLGLKIIDAKRELPAFRLFQGAVKTRIVNRSAVRGL